MILQKQREYLTLCYDNKHLLNYIRKTEASENLMHGSLDVLHISKGSELVNVHENCSPFIK